MTWFLSSDLTCENLVADVQKGREEQQANFTLVCRDSAGEQITRGGEQVLISIVHRDRKNWWVCGSPAFCVNQTFPQIKSKWLKKVMQFGPGPVRKHQKWETWENTIKQFKAEQDTAGEDLLDHEDVLLSSGFKVRTQKLLISTRRPNFPNYATERTGGGSDGGMVGWRSTPENVQRDSSFQPPGGSLYVLKEHIWVFNRH